MNRRNFLCTGTLAGAAIAEMPLKDVRHLFHGEEY